MTVEKCAVACKGSPSFGVEYGRECYCGSNLNSGSVQVAESQCSFSCPGDASEKCGAGNRLNVYDRIGVAKTTSTPPAGPTKLPTYTHQGCYSEPSSGRGWRANPFTTRPRQLRNARSPAPTTRISGSNTTKNATAATPSRPGVPPPRNPTANILVSATRRKPAAAICVWIYIRLRRLRRRRCRVRITALRRRVAIRRRVMAARWLERVSLMMR